MDYYQQQGTESFGAAPGGGPKRQQRGPVCESDEHTELKEKVVIPLEKYPGYNFVGSLLGPQGSILKALQKGVNAKISIFGKGSMRDKEKEKELYTSEDPEHAHLKEPLHVLIEVKAPRADAHWRMANALTEVYKFMVPPPDHQGGGGHDNGAGYGYGNEGGFDQGYGGGAPSMRGGRGGAPRGGPPRGGPRGGGPPRGGPRGAPRGGRGGGMLASRGGAARGGGAGGGAPPAGGDSGYGYQSNQETTNYQWDGNYSQTNYNTTGYPSQTAAGAEQNANNGYGLKRPYEQSYDQSGYGSGY